MNNHNAASDLGGSYRVSGGHASGTRARTVCSSALALDDESSCSAGRLRLPRFRFPIVCNFLNAVVIARRWQSHADTQRDAGSVDIVMPCRDGAWLRPEVAHNATHDVRPK